MNKPGGLIVALLVAGTAIGALLYALGGDDEQSRYDIEDFLAGKVDADAEPSQASAAPLPAAAHGAAGGPGLDTVASLIDGLKRRLENDGGDVEGWILLAKSHSFIEQWQQADAAYRRALALGYAGEWRPRPPVGAPSASTARATGGDPGIASGVAIQVRVSLDSSLKGRVPADAPLFVFARNPSGGGPPLAVARHSAGQLPMTLTLSDADAMLAGNNLSSAEQIVVGARISISGSASAQPGDFESLSSPLSPDSTERVELVIEFDN